MDLKRHDDEDIVRPNGTGEEWNAELEAREKAEPHRFLLAALLREPDLIHMVRGRIAVDDFTEHRHRMIYRAMLDMTDACDLIEAASLYTELNRREPARMWAGFVYELFDELPTGTNAEYYASLVRGKSIYRKLFKLLGEMKRDVADEVESPDTTIETCLAKIAAITAGETTGGPLLSMAEAVEAAMGRYEAKHRGEEQAFSTGIESLDEELGGGFSPGQLITLAALTGVGKTVMAQQFAKAIAFGTGKHVLYCSFEMSGVELSSRALVTEGKVDNTSVRGTPSATDMLRLRQAADQLKPLPISFMRIPVATVAAVEPLVARLSRQHHGLGLVVLDYLQLMTGNRRSSRTEQVSEISRANKQLAGKYSVPVLQLSQFNRMASSIEGGGRPRMHHLKESGSIEQDSDAIMILHPDRNEGDRHTLYIDKQRNGPRESEICLRNMPGQFRFTQAARH